MAALMRSNASRVTYDEGVAPAQAEGTSCQHARHLRHHGLATHIGREILTRVESRPIGQAGRKGVGLVLVACDQDAGHAFSIGGSAAGAASNKRRV